MPKVYVPTIMRPLTKGQSMLKIPGGTVAELLASMDTQYPGIQAQLCDDGGQIKHHIAIFVNEENIRDLEGQATPIDERDEVHIIPAIAGG